MTALRLRALLVKQCSFFLACRYQADHSENLQLHHYTHHTRADSVYSIYAKIRFVGEAGGGSDKVKPLLERWSSAESRNKF